MTALTVADMSTAFHALETVDVQLYRDPVGFAAWCKAFEIDTEQLEAQSTGFHYFTLARTRYAGVTWVIVLDHLDLEWRAALNEPEAVAA